MISKLKFIFFLILGLLILNWVYKFFAGPESINLILENKFKLFFLVFAHIPTLYFDSLAWVVFMTKKKLSLANAFIITWIAQTSGKFFPTGNITGEFVRIYLAKKSGQETSEASSTVLADLFIATLTLFTIGLLSFFYILSINSSKILNDNYLYFIFSLFIIFLACLLFFIVMRKRLISNIITKLLVKFSFKFKKNNIDGLKRLDLILYRLSFEKKIIMKAFIFRILGWIAGAFEIYVFLLIIGIEATLIDVILIESVTSIIKSLAFFIPAGLGVQEFAFVLIGEFVGFSGVISFSIAIGRRLREIMVGLPALLTWYLLYTVRSKNL